MTSLSRRRWIAPSLALTLAVGVVGALSAPASAVRTSFANNSGVAISDRIYEANNTTITINDNGPATPYPSTINVAESGTIVDVNVTLDGVSHTWPEDVDILLVGPQGQQATLMSDAGGSLGLVGGNITLDDEAADPLPELGQLADGTFRPGNYDTLQDPYPATAPSSTGNSALSVFDGTNAQGNWRLFVVDDELAATGSISSGWDIDILVQSVPYPSQVNVSGLGTRVSDVNLNLSGLTHTYPDDIDMLLVGPGGQHVTVMSDAGGGDDVAGLNLVLDDEALAGLPDDDALTTGNFRPTDVVETDYPDMYGPPAPASASGGALSVFDGTNPNGAWSLYIIDDASTDQGTLSGWSLDIETDNTPPTGTVTINGGAPTVASTSVTLTLAASDPGSPTSGVTDMRFSNDGATFSAFQPYASTAAWTLTSGDGTKTVYAQFRDGSGNLSAVVSDTVTFQAPDTTGPTVTKTTPKKNAKNVKVTTKVKVKVSEALKGSTVTKKTVFLKAKGSSDKVKAKVSYNSSKKMIVLTPSKALKKNKKYNVTVTTKVKDLAGNAFDAKPGKSGAQALKFSFTTA